MDCLRSFASIAELGSFAGAADRVGRSVSAVSLQIDRLEAQLGVDLFRRDGRRKVLTEAGERMLLHAKQILGANDVALSALAQEAISGPVRVGVVQDLAEHILAGVLGDFARANRDVRLDVRVERTQLLVDAVEAGDLDLAISFEARTGLEGESLAEVPMIWIALRDGDAASERPLPMVLFEAPCAFRAIALRALEGAGMDWRLALSSPGLSGLRAGVEAGLGVTVRTKAFLAAANGRLREATNLPALPAIRFLLYRGQDAQSPAAALLSELCRERLRLL